MPTTTPQFVFQALSKIFEDVLAQVSLYNTLNSLRNGVLSGFVVLGLPGFFPIVLILILRFVTLLINHRRRQGHNSCVSNNTFSWRKILTNTTVIYRYKAYVKVAAATVGIFSPLYLSIACSFKQYNNIFCWKKCNKMYHIAILPYIWISHYNYFDVLVQLTFIFSNPKKYYLAS